MQHSRVIVLLIIIAALYSSHAFSTPPSEYFMGEATSPNSPEPHIALLLPLQSSIFREAANVVKEGFDVAARHEQSLLAIKSYATTEDPLDILSVYHYALNAGAVLVVGPLTRDGVIALASSDAIEVPTLALNTPDFDVALPPNLYLFGLQIESEARQIVELAITENKHHAIIITDDSPLSIRLQTAFAEQWLLAEYGNTAESVRYEDDQTVLQQFRKHTASKNSVVFLALGAIKSRMILAYLSPKVPVYATSQLYASSNGALFNYDLNGIKFMDMPWLLTPDHPAVAVYRETTQSEFTDMERFYALGIDAFRLAAHMFQAQFADDISFDGVTGHIYFSPPNQFVREPLFAQFDKGEVILLDVQEEK